MKNKIIASACFLLCFSLNDLFSQPLNKEGQTERQYCVKLLTKIADPVLNALSKGELRKKMPVEASDSSRDQWQVS